MEKKVSFQALQANELIKFLPKREILPPKKRKFEITKMAKFATVHEN